jgi:hypothetical protein
MLLPGIKTSPDRLPVYGDDFPVDIPFYGSYPGHKALLYCFRFEPGKDPPIYIMFRYAMFQREKLFQPEFLRFAIFFDVFPPFGIGPLVRAITASRVITMTSING